MSVPSDDSISAPCIFLGNFDQGIQLSPRVFVPNIDDAFVGRTVGALALKCMEVAPRAVHLIGPDEAAVLYQPLPPSYAEYCERLYGYVPLVFSPRRQYENLEEPLSLLTWVLEDERLLAEIARFGSERGLVLDPFIGNPLVFDLARRTGLPVSGISERDVLRGVVGDLNDKALFQVVCRELGIPVVPSVHVTGWDALVAEAESQFKRNDAVMLRRSRAAGGLGNCEVSSAIVRAARCETVRAYLERALTPREEWSTETVLVEPVLNIVASPGALYHAAPDGRVAAVTIADQVIENMCFLGSEYPTACDSSLRRRMTELGMRYAEAFVAMGGVGYFNVDWGITDAGDLVAFESNARYTGCIHGLEAMRRLGASDACAWSNDALKVHPSTRFEKVDAFLRRDGIGWNNDRKEGVVATIPPAGVGQKKTIGCIAIASTRARVAELRASMTAFARSTFSGS